MSQSRIKRCRYCRKWFEPDPRVAKQQKACSNADCRKKRKKHSQKLWINKNPDYFKGRYENTRDWLKKHPGYLKEYRETHPEYVDKNRRQQKERRVKRTKDRTSKRVDIQDTMKPQGVVNIEDSLKISGVDIQDAMKPQLIIPVHVRDNLWDVDIQDDIYKAFFNMYTSGRYISRTKLKEFTKGIYHGRRRSCSKKDFIFT